MKFVATVLAVAQLGTVTVLASPAVAPAKQRMGARDLCANAANCEVVIDEAGIPYPSFKENMGPGTEWFNKTVAPRLNRRGPLEQHIARDIDTSGECKGEGTCTIAAMSDAREWYGTVDPVEMTKKSEVPTSHSILISC